MANTSNSYGGKLLVDPVLLRDVCIDAQPPLPVETWWGRANLFTCPVGEKPGRGAVLLRRGDLDDLDLTTDHELTFDDFEHPPVTLKKITATRATCLTPGLEGDGDAAYLVELADRRLHLARVPVSKAYNLVKPDGTAYHAATLNSGTAWTWAGMIGDLWAAVGGLGSFPGLPFAPHDEPDGFNYYGEFAWAALNHALTRVACAVEYDPTADTFSIVRLGEEEAAAEDAFKALKPDRTWDTYPVDPDRGGRPEKIRVLFRRFPAPDGGTDPYHAVDVTLPAKPGVVAGSVVVLRDDLTALGATGAPTNAATLTARAQERADDWVRKWEGHDRRLTRVYAGFRAEGRTAVGPTAAVVAWEDRGGGRRTEVGAGPDGRLEAWDPGPGPDPAAAGVFVAHVVVAVKTSDGPPRRYTCNGVELTGANVYGTTGASYTNCIEAQDRVVVLGAIGGAPGAQQSVAVPLYQLPDGTYYFQIDQTANSDGTTFWPGHVGTAAQHWKGPKKFRDTVRVQAANGGAGVQVFYGADATPGFQANDLIYRMIQVADETMYQTAAYADRVVRGPTGGPWTAGDSFAVPGAAVGLLASGSAGGLTRAAVSVTGTNAGFAGSTVIRSFEVIGMSGVNWNARGSVTIDGVHQFRGFGLMSDGGYTSESFGTTRSGGVNKVTYWGGATGGINCPPGSATIHWFKSGLYIGPTDTGAPPTGVTFTGGIALGLTFQQAAATPPDDAALRAAVGEDDAAVEEEDQWYQETGGRPPGVGPTEIAQPDVGEG